INFLAIELIDCRCGFFVAGHFDEPEASRTSSVAIFDDARRLDRAGLSKQFLQLLTGSLESEVSHIKFRCHRFNLSLFGLKKKLRESDWLRRNGCGRRTRFGCSYKERLLKFEYKPHSRTHPNAGANRFMRGAHHR